VKSAVAIGVGLIAGVDVAVGGKGVTVSEGVADAGISVAAGEQPVIATISAIKTTLMINVRMDSLLYQ
jgi:formaldehyde-activating enzyme involved in methanogenesis